MSHIKSMLITSAIGAMIWQGRDSFLILNPPASIDARSVTVVVVAHVTSLSATIVTERSDDTERKRNEPYPRNF